MGHMLPYILPLLLGRTFNLDKMQVGVDIFPLKEINRKVVINNPVTETHYKIIDKMTEVRDLLDVEGSFSLNIKAGMFKAGAAGQYLADTYDRQNTVDVTIKTTYQTITEQLPADAKPVDSWQSLGDEALGTHFVRSITYGGEMISSVRMECNNTKDKQKIKAALELGGKVDVFDLGIQVEGEYMKDIAKSVESTQIKIFSSIPLSKVPNDMDSLKKVLDDFPEDLKKFNEGKGVPLKIELWPLNLLDPSRPQHTRNKLLEATLESFEQKFDDLLNTKTAITKWMNVMKKPLSEEQEDKIGDYYETIGNTIKEFYGVIGSLDMSKGTDQLQPAITAYGNNIPGTFFRKYLLLRQEIAGDQGDWTRSRGNGVTYIHWGRLNCSDAAEQMSEGVVIGPSGFGSGSNFLCLPENSTFETVPTNLKNAAIVQGASFKFPGEDGSRFFCSSCRLGTKGSVQVFSGQLKCPSNWDYIYDGLLMSGSHNAVSTTFVCLDKNAEKNADIKSRNFIIPNWVLPVTGRKDQRMLVPCVVCAK